MSIPPDPFVSGDLRAEGRLVYARRCAVAADWRAASDILEQTVDLVPHWAPGWFELAQAREKTSDFEGAAAAFRRVLALDPQDLLGAGPRLAVLEGAQTRGLPAAYVRRLFDDYAPRFVAHLVGDLGYRAPDVLIGLIEDAYPNRRFPRTLDLGCGTGLAAAVLAARSDDLTGVDLSAAMIEKARGRGLYSQLSAVEARVHLDLLPPADLDLIFAADVVVYFGALEELFTSAQRALRPQGLLAFTCERTSTDEFRLNATMRFAHSAAYIRSVASASGFCERVFVEVAVRAEKGAPALGFAVVLQKADEGAVARNIAGR